MTNEEREEIEELKKRVEFLEKASREHTTLISKIADNMYILVEKVKDKL